MRGKRLVYGAALATTISLVACASQEVAAPTDTISDASSAIERAKQADAYTFSAFEVVNAERKLDRAKRLAAADKNKDWIQANRLAEQALVDARLAETRAQLAQARNAYQAMKKRVDTLRQEQGSAPGKEGSS